MARKPALVAVEDTFDDLAAVDLEEVVEEELEDALEAGISLDDAVSELSELVSDAVDFMTSEMLTRWEDAEEYYNGLTDIPKQKGRSQVSKTVVRDSIRALKPNMMRVFTQYDQINEFYPANPLDFAAAAVAQGQTKYVNQLFWEAGGYKTLLNNVHNTLLKKVGVMKSHYVEDWADEYYTLTSVTPEQLEALRQMPDLFVVSVEEEEVVPPAVSGLLHVEVARRRSNGAIKLDDVNLDEFFVDDQATCPEDARVIGERRSVNVGYARSIGLEYDGDWRELDDFDIEENEGAGGSQARRGYAQSWTPADSVDISLHKFLLTEVYVKFDLDGTGIPQLYRFWLGGTNYEYIDHERVSENPYSVTQADPVPGAFFGRSVVDVVLEDQNTQTSLLRATCDNAHAANNKRLAVHDTLVNMQDVMNSALGAPIRVRSPGQIQEISVESSIGAMLPLLQYLEETSNNKLGVTNASMGLDPDALQSTDKEAVRNTIQLAQGQVELMCRNIAETGLKTAFQKLLRLSMRHRPSEQAVFIDGQAIPINQSLFVPEMSIRTKVGLGTGSLDMRLAALNQVAQKQQEIITQYGMTNPICNIGHLLNTVVDIGTLLGLPNMGRYFNAITPDIAQQLEQFAAQKAAEAQPEPPSQAIAVGEQIRAQARIQEQELESETAREKQSNDTLLKIMELLMNDDLKRDEMAQKLGIENAKILGTNVDKMEVQAQQAKDRDYDAQKQLLGYAMQNAQEERQMRMQREMAQMQAQQEQQAQGQQGPQ